MKRDECMTLSYNKEIALSCRKDMYRVSAIHDGRSLKDLVPITGVSVINSW